ncbi:hypothetical protein N7492_002616 [Penicillium capsulatum]|uniref:Uncharacterized protein n=1 Tax=Penicillium capsulatum TaxID=69766 RepID=A0A9W9ILQ5_9EURO|nr:hypothetical protein N7492_002616 [Penicillium capsulatum]KAJ6122783.1 hypothetical protein N7512_005248 [Penicillium capsulatum]
MPPDESPTHIPPLGEPLAPYVKSRQEALRIRQALTCYLRSLVIFDDADPSTQSSHLALRVPTDRVTDVKRIPIDLTGLRKQYLQALQANVAARKEFRAVSQDVASLRHQRAPKPRSEFDDQDPGADLRDYLLLLRDRRRQNKLQVFRHYLDELKEKEVVGLEGLEEDNTSSPEVLLPEGIDADMPTGRGNESDLEGLVHKLERAVVRARGQLDQEKQLFEKIKARHDARDRAAAIAPAAKFQALQRTRDELVQWVEERLVAEGDPDESLVQDLPPEEIEEAQQALADQKTQIAEQYAAYLEARRELLDAASRACQPVTVTSKPPTRSTPNEASIQAIPPPNPLDVLAHANENLVPLSKSQKALALQKSYLSGLLAKEKSTALRALHRLSDESHLLPEYPMLARQPRFKHAVAALDSRNSPPAADQAPPDEVKSLAEAWNFASEAAATNQRDYVQQKVALGTEVARDARQTLGEVYNTLNQDLESVLQDGTEHRPDASDIWTSEAHSTRGLSKSSAPRIEKRAKGPWAGLHGRVGV